MVDLLAHALFAYAACTLLGVRVAWIGPRYVTVGMAGAFVPDLSKLRLVVPESLVREAIGLPFAWGGLHTAGGSLVSIAIGVVLVEPGERRRVAAMLAIGAASHLLADAMLRTATGYSGHLLWPFVPTALPTPGLYLSTEPWPTLVAAGLAVGVRVIARHGRGVEG